MKITELLENQSTPFTREDAIKLCVKIKDDVALQDRWVETANHWLSQGQKRETAIKWTNGEIWEELKARASLAKFPHNVRKRANNGGSSGGGPGTGR